MASKCVGFSLLLISCLLALASSAPLSPVTSQELEDGDDALINALNLGKPNNNDDHATPLSGDVEDRTPLADDDDADDDDAPKSSYVDASVFRKNAPTGDAVKPKPSFFVKKSISNINKNAKKGREDTKEDISVPSDRLEPPVVDQKSFDFDVDNKEATDTVAESVTSTTTTSEASMTSSGINEKDELPRLSPPIWLHSSLAEAMSDPLRLPMIEPYDRYDRYSHSIARDSLW